MFFIPRFLKPPKNLKKILQVYVGADKKTSIQKLIKSVDVYREPLQLVFLLACAVLKYDKKLLTNQLAGVLSHERFGNAMNMAAFQKICKLYNENNIPVLAQKGLVYKLLYPTSTRPMNDADFCIPKHFYRHGIDLAVQNDFHINHDMLFSADLQFKNMGCVDVHYAVFKGANPDMVDIMFARAKPMHTIGCDVLIPCPEDIIVIILCEFYGNFIYEAGSTKTDIKTIFASHPQWVLDMNKTIIDNPDLNWGKIMRTAKMSGYDYQIKILMKLLNQIIPGIVSTHTMKIIDVMCPDAIVRKYLKRDKKIVKLHAKNHKIYMAENI